MNSKTTLTKRKNVLAAMVGLFAAAGGASSAMAQGDEAATAQGRISDRSKNASLKDTVLEEIIVTGERRGKKSIRDTPMSISALSGDTIEKRGLVGMEDYLPTLPGVSMQDRGAGQNNIIMRGIASDPQIEDSTVGVYFGETSVTGLGSTSPSDTSGSLDIKWVDIERIEVLRGPQGTLYGSGSIGGTVRVLPASPNLEEVELKLTTRYSQTGEEGGDNSMAQAVINLPLIENELAIRAVAYQFENSGYIDNVAASQPTAEVFIADAIAASGLARDRNEVGGDQYTGFRISALWQPTDKLSLTLAYIQQEIEQDGRPEVNNGLPGRFQQVRMRTGPGGTRDEFLNNEVDITNLVVEYDFGWGEVINSASWIDYQAMNEIDQSYSPVLSGIFGGAIYAANDSENDVFAEELRFLSKFDGPAQIGLGLYYEDIEFSSLSPLFWSGDITLTDPSSHLVDSNKDSSTQQKALFGELTYEFTKKISATFGFRHFDYDQKIESFVALFDEALVLVDDSPSKDERGESFKINLTYTPNDDILLYGLWSEGFRLGKADARPSPTCDPDGNGILNDINVAIPDGVDSDTSESLEFGIKTALFENHLTLNIAAYHIKWQDMPVSISLPSCADSVTLNVGESKSEGIEFEAQAVLSDNLRLNVGASYGEATLTEDAENLGGNLGSKGQNLPGSADYNISMGVEYHFTLAGYEAFARGDYAYVGEYYHDFDETGEASGDYNQVNLKTGVSLDSLELDLFVNNLTNSDDFTWLETSNRNFFGIDRAYRLRPRTVGFNITYQF